MRFPRTKPCPPVPRSRPPASPALSLSPAPLDAFPQGFRLTLLEFRPQVLLRSHLCVIHRRLFLFPPAATTALYSLPHPASCQRRHQAPPTLHTGPDLPPPADPIPATQATSGLANCCPPRARAGPGHAGIGSSHALKAPQGVRAGRRPSRLLHP